MYEKFFTLSHRPFAAAPNLECIVAHQGYVEARERLLRCLTDGSGMAVLTAPAGLGKSLLSQDIQNRLRGRFTVAYLCSAQFPGRKALLQGILFELGVDYLGLSEEEARLEVMKAAQAAAAKERSLVLVIDEAHLMATELLQELRGLAEPSTRCPTPVRLMLCGQLELEERLADHDLAAINERIACHAILEPLTQVESAEYVQERLAIAGATTPKFSEEALAFIVRASDGNPRCLNQLCDHCLLSSYTIEERPVSLETARNSLEDLRALPLHWNDAGLSDESETTADDFEDPLAEAIDADEPTAEHAVDPTAAERTATISEDAPTPFWTDSPLVGVFEFGSVASEPVAPEPVESTDAALFASVAPWPAVPVEPAGQEIVDAISALDDSNSEGSEPHAADEPETIAFGTEQVIEAEAESLDDESEFADDDTTFEYNPSIISPFQYEPETGELIDEEYVVDDRYAALDRASEALSAHLPQAPELLAFLSQYAIRNEPRRHEEPAASATTAVAVVEPETDTTEEELLETIRELQDQLRRASVDRPRPVDPAEAWKIEPIIEPVYDIVEPPESVTPAPVVEAPVAATPVMEFQSPAPVIEAAAAPAATVIEFAAEERPGRFAQLFSRMRQKRRAVEDRLRKNADWI